MVRWIRKDAGTPEGGQFAGLLSLASPPAGGATTVSLTPTAGGGWETVEDDVLSETRTCANCEQEFSYAFDRWSPDLCDACADV